MFCLYTLSPNNVQLKYQLNLNFYNYEKFYPISNFIGLVCVFRID